MPLGVDLIEHPHDAKELEEFFADFFDLLAEFLGLFLDLFELLLGFLGRVVNACVLFTFEDYRGGFFVLFGHAGYFSDHSPRSRGRTRE
jgi:hypothetical protein